MYYLFILFVILYADESLVLSDNPKYFQAMLNVFNEFCKKCKLKINTDKTKAVIFNILLVSSNRAEYLSSRY